MAALCYLHKNQLVRQRGSTFETLSNLLFGISRKWYKSQLCLEKKLEKSSTGRDSKTGYTFHETDGFTGEFY